MKEFILVRDANSSDLMLIRKSMICSVESVSKNGKMLRKISYTDCRPEEYVTDTFMDIIKELEEGYGCS